MFVDAYFLKVVDIFPLELNLLSRFAMELERMVKLPTMTLQGELFYFSTSWLHGSQATNKIFIFYRNALNYLKMMTKRSVGGKK